MGSTSTSQFETRLAEATKRGSNVVPGCILTAIDKHGNFLYKGSAGYQSAAPDAPPIDPDGVLWIASCSKLITSICALQMVEQGLVDLDEDISRVIPELSKPQIVKLDSTAEKGYTLTPAAGHVTLRQLLTHTSGVGYYFMSEAIQKWRNDVGPSPLSLAGTVVKTFTAPLLFEPGQGWVYGGGVDWAGVVVHRLSGKDLAQYMDDHVFKPLGMTSTTFQLGQRHDLAKRLIPMTERKPDGTLAAHGLDVWMRAPPEASGGAGLWASMPDYMKVLTDLLQPSSQLLKQETIDSLLFTPQIPSSSPAIKDLVSARSATASNAVGADSGINHSLGGMLITQYAPESGLPAGTLTWGGYPNLKWFVNREYGVAGLYGSQVIPPGDPPSMQLANEFCKEVMRLADGKNKEGLRN